VLYQSKSQNPLILYLNLDSTFLQELSQPCTNYPYITYCSSTWSSTYVSNLNRMFYLQKRAVREKTNSYYRAHSAPLFAKLGIMDIFQINSFQISKFVFYYHNQVPVYPLMFLNLFETSCQVHNYGT